MTKVFSIFAWIVAIVGGLTFVCFAIACAMGIGAHNYASADRGAVGAAIGAALTLLAGMQLTLASGMQTRLAAA